MILIMLNIFLFFFKKKNPIITIKIRSILVLFFNNQLAIKNQDLYKRELTRRTTTYLRNLGGGERLSYLQQVGNILHRFQGFT